MVSEALIKGLFNIQNPQLLKALSEAACVETFKKRQDIYRIGEKYSNFYILLNGLVYTYFFDGGESPLTTCFFTERHDYLKVEALGQKTTSGAKALKQSEVFVLPVNESVQLAKDYPELMWEYARYLQKTMMYLCVLNNKRMYLSSEERYLWFYKTFPEVVQLANNQQIASFIRMRSESFSRLKSQHQATGGERKKQKLDSDILMTKDMTWNYQNIKDMMRQK